MPESSLRLVERDLNLFRDLFRYRSLTISQIRELHFSRYGAFYVYKRLKRLEEHQYILIRSTFFGDTKAGVVSIGEKGIRMLLSKEIITKEEASVKANHLRKLNTAYHLKNSMDARTLYVRLQSDGWSFTDGREFKAALNLNRGNKVLGSLTSPDSVEYPLYILDRNFKDRTIAKVMTEIKTSPFHRALIMYRGTGTADYERIVAAHRRAMEEQRLVASIHVFPFLRESVELIKRTLAPSCLVKYFTNTYGRVHESKNRFLLASYELEHKGERKFVLEYLSHDLYRTFALERYGETAYRETKKKCLVFTWDAYESELEPYLKNQSHFEVITLSLGDDLMSLPVFSSENELAPE